MDELLKYAIESGMLDLSYVQEKIEMNKRKELLEKHPYKIWEGKNGKWYTYIPDEEKGRVQKERKSKSAIENFIVEFWKEKLDNPTIEQVFEEWILKKIEHGEISKSTRDRYKRQYEESFSEFGKNKIKEVDECDIEDFLLETLHKKKMTSKGFSNLRTLVFGIFKYAKKKKYIKFSITEVVGDIEISKKNFRKNIKSDEETVFMDDELPKVMEYLEENLDILNIGLLVLFKSGLRIGELAALKCEDVSGNVIHVGRTEICYKEENNTYFVVRDFPKTEAGMRTVVIPQKYEKYLERAKEISSGEYLFEISGQRIKTYQFRQRLKTVCKNANVVRKSPHKIRKTYASILIDSGVSESVIISQMGHTDIKTTKGFYYRNRKNQEEKQEVINSLDL